jgi:hypothetical protein
MAGKKISFDAGLVAHIFQNADLAGIGDANGLLKSAGGGNFYLALYTTPPSDSYQGIEATFGNYVRMPIPRSVNGWSVSGFDAINVLRVVFPMCSNVSGMVNSFSINTGSAAGVDDAIYWGYLAKSLNVIQGTNVVFAIGSFSM